MSKDEVQREALEIFTKNPVGTIILPTGMGKTRLGVMAHKSLGGKCVVVTSRIPLIEQWKQEFAATYPEADYEILIINTARKLTLECDLLIVDEAHRAFSPASKKVFEGIRYKALLCLTATLPKDADKVEMMQQIAPIIYSKQLDDASGALAPYEVFNFEVTMDRKTAALYKTFDQMFNSGRIALARLWSKYYKHEYASIFELAKAMAPLKEKEEVHLAARRYWSGMSLRKKTLYECPSKIDAIRKILQRFPRRKWLVFTKSITFAEKTAAALGCEVYHSKLSTKERERILETFKNNNLPLITVDALNEGLNVVDVDSAICAAGASTDLENIQRLGRILRQKEGKKALFINLYVPNTQEEKWIREKTSKLKNVTWSNELSA